MLLNTIIYENAFPTVHFHDIYSGHKLSIQQQKKELLVKVGERDTLQ